MDIKAIQDALKNKGIDGWLLYDFHNRDHLAYRILDMDFEKMTSRRWFYFIPVTGEPVRLAHRVEPKKLDSLPGKLEYYHPWIELHAKLKEILGEPKTIAMQYSPMCNIPYTSIVDGGTIELIRSLGHEVVSSADLVQLFEAIIDEKGYQSHLKACDIIQGIKDEAFAKIGEAIKNGEKLTEYEVAKFILDRFEEDGIDPGHDIPIVGVNDQYSWKESGQLGASGRCLQVYSTNDLVYDGESGDIWNNPSSESVGRSDTCLDEVFVVNKKNIAQLTDMFVYDASTTTYVSQLPAAAFPYFLLPSPFAVGDIVYFGVDPTLQDHAFELRLPADVKTLY